MCIRDRIYITFIIYGLYFYRRKESWAKNFIIVTGLALTVSIWESASLNYLDLSTGARGMETIITGSTRIVLLIVLALLLMKEVVIPYLKNRFRKNSD